ncbi:E3 ubiquitin-protein ligase TRIM56-like [Branchiostoma lanceolatum]|uniref:E3 ubiquitin-protein ligase TRIM56-like n=1 Tax=Branchiostoma lanceolatum TaxID=7740 RepID=UPI003452B760
MATASFTEKVSDEFIQCTICCYNFKNPKVLPCLHTFCAHCLREWVQKNDGDTFPCPICREPVSLPPNGVEGLKDNFFLANLVKAVSEDNKVRHGQDGLLCTTCEEGKPATSRCSECAEFLCESCESAHRLQRATKGHTLFTFEELKTGKYDGVFRTRKAPPCSKHSGEILKLYCRTCETPICNECALFEHRDSQHDYTRIEEVATEKRNTILDLTPQSQARMQFIQTEDVQNRLKEQLQIHTEGARQNVHKTVQTLIALVKEEGERLLSCIDSEETMRKKQIEAEIEGAQISLASAKSTCEFAETLAREGGDYEVVSFSQDLTTRLNDLNKQPADTVNFELANITIDYSVMRRKLRQNTPPLTQYILTKSTERELASILKRESQSWTSSKTGLGPKQQTGRGNVARGKAPASVYPGPTQTYAASSSYVPRGTPTPYYPYHHPTPNYYSSDSSPAAEVSRNGQPVTHSEGRPRSGGTYKLADMPDEEEEDVINNSRNGTIVTVEQPVEPDILSYIIKVHSSKIIAIAERHRVTFSLHEEKTVVYFKGMKKNAEDALEDFITLYQGLFSKLKSIPFDTNMHYVKSDVCQYAVECVQESHPSVFIKNTAGNVVFIGDESEVRSARAQICSILKISESRRRKSHTGSIPTKGNNKCSRYSAYR